MTEKGICPIQTVFGILGGKWKHRILLELHPGPMRYNQLAASIGTISYKVLTHSSSGNWRKTAWSAGKSIPKCRPGWNMLSPKWGRVSLWCSGKCAAGVWNVTRCMSRCAATAGNAGDGKRPLPVPQMCKIAL